MPKLMVVLYSDLLQLGLDNQPPTSCTKAVDGSCHPDHGLRAYIGIGEDTMNMRYSYNMRHCQSRGSIFRKVGHLWGRGVQGCPDKGHED